MIRALLLALSFAAVPAAAGRADSDAPVIDAPAEVTTYEVTIEGSPSEAVTEDLQKALNLFRYQENGAPSVALLRRRALDDREIGGKVLRSYGYYLGTMGVDVTVGESEREASVTVTVEPGPAFTLARHDFALQPVPLAEALPDGMTAGSVSPVGGAAEAAAILDAEDAMVQALRHSGFPYARRTGRDAVADMENFSLAVTTSIDTGPRLMYGDLNFQGTANIDETYLRTYQPWQKGEAVDTRKLTQYQRSLIGTGLFNAGAVLLPEEPPEPGAVPVVAEMEQRKFRSIGVGLSYSTDLGPRVEVDFEHRNLFGANEILQLGTDVALPEQRFDASLRKPQFRRNQQDLVTAISLRHLELDAFDETGATLTVGLERQLSRHWRVGLGGLAEVTETVSSDAKGRSYLLGMPGFAEYDSSNDLLNPSQGWRIRLSATPFAGQFDSQFAPFFSTEAKASTYFDLTGEKRYVAAIRGRLGSILAGDMGQVPAGRRLYGGGGGSVRGYAERSLGPLDAQNDPTGGRSVVELGLELRAQFYGDFGIAVFADAGSVTEDVVPTFSDGLQYAAGIGLRYHTPLGPIRADVAIPLNPRNVDDAYQLYFSIGQAF